MYFDIFFNIPTMFFFQIQMNFFSNESGDSGEEDIYGTESPDKRKSAAILNSQTQNSKDQDGELFKFTCIHPAKAKLECSRVQYIYFNRNISFNLIKS